MFQDIKAGLEDAIAWERGEDKRRVTIFTESGNRLEPAMLTREQHEAQIAALAADKPAEPASEAVTLLAQLLTWTGREVLTPEDAEQVNDLRRRAETLLQQAGVRETAPRVA